MKYTIQQIQTLLSKLDLNELKIWAYFASLPSNYQTSKVPIEDIKQRYPDFSCMKILYLIDNLKEKGLVEETKPNTLTFYKYFKEEPTP